MALGKHTKQFLQQFSQRPKIQTARGVIAAHGIAYYRSLAGKFYQQFYLPPDPRINIVQNTINHPNGHKLSCKIYRAPTNTNSPALIYFPGGASVLSLSKAYDHACVEIALKSGCTVIKVDTRLAPEYSRFDAFDDAYFAACYFYQHAENYRLDNRYFIIGGNSSGAHLAALVSNKARADQQLSICLQLLITPTVDMSLTLRQQAEYTPYQEQDIMLSLADQAYFTELSIPPTIDRKDPGISPYYDSLSDLPPSIIIFGEYDGTRGDAEAYYEKLISSGNIVERHCLRGQIHAAMLGYKLLADPPYQASLAGKCIASLLKRA